MADDKAGCLGGFWSLFFGGGSRPGAGSPPAAVMPKVMVNKFFVTEAEANFFRVLRAVVGDRGHILGQVAMNRLVFFPGNRQSSPSRGTWQNKVAQKSIDFVVCDPQTLRPIVAIELDDRTHAQPERRARDQTVVQILAAAGLPLLRLGAARSYDTRELADALRPYFR